MAAGLPSFAVGEIYQRWPDLNDRYGGGRQGGISDSARAPVTFLFTGDSGERYGYADRFDDDEGTFFFSGEGQKGDMRFVRGNMAVRDHSSRGKALHLFRTVGKGKGQKYLGEFVYQGHDWVRAPDIEDAPRDAIIFRLVPVACLEQLELASAESPAEALTLQESRSRAIAASKVDGLQDSKRGNRTVYERSRAVRDYVLLRAAGKCELCEQPAPFRRSGGLPYLEPHHTTRVSDGGPDHPQFVAALCPACHREVHYGEHAQEKNIRLVERLLTIEAAGPI